MQPEVRESMAEGGRRDFALLTEGGGSLAMRPLYAELDAEEQLRDLHGLFWARFGRGEKV